LVDIISCAALRLLLLATGDLPLKVLHCYLRLLMMHKSCLLQMPLMRYGQAKDLLQREGQ
jgi:hypothetical protein